MNESTTLRGPRSRRASYVSAQCILQRAIGEIKVGYIYVALMSLKTFADDFQEERACVLLNDRYGESNKGQYLQNMFTRFCF